MHFMLRIGFFGTIISATSFVAGCGAEDTTLPGETLAEELPGDKPAFSGSTHELGPDDDGPRPVAVPGEIGHPVRGVRGEQLGSTTYGLGTVGNTTTIAYEDFASGGAVPGTLGVLYAQQVYTYNRGAQFPVKGVAGITIRY